MTREGCQDRHGNQAQEGTEGLRCKCCNYKVRTKPRNSFLKEKFHNIVANTGNIFEDEPLQFPSLYSLNESKEEIKKEILIDDETIEQIVSTLVSGKNILLVGAVGSGKTHLSTILPRIVWNEIGGYNTQVYTATADWTTQEVIGGIVPKISENGKPSYNIQLGCVSETVSQNWLNGTSQSEKRVFVEYDDEDDNDDVRKFRGTWLTIDEFNRANIDRAFGQLFTALEYQTLQLPTTDNEKSYEELKIPKDYRIIGTLNTADKHFLHTLSDALKRRFAIIELPIPTIDQKETELYYVVKKSLKDLENVRTTLKVDDQSRQVISGSDIDAENILDSLYLLMTYIREIKPVGTALMISMFRFMVSHHTITGNWEKSLDLALTSNIAPQLESLPYWTLKVAKSIFSSTPGIFFRTDAEILREGIDKYKNDFEHAVNFIGKFKKIPRRQILNNFKNSTLAPEDYDMLDPWDKDLIRPKLPSFRKTLEQIIQEKGIFEEVEFGNEEQ